MAVHRPARRRPQRHPYAPQWRVQLRTGRDQPRQPQRPGGAQHETSLRTTLSLPQGSAGPGCWTPNSATPATPPATAPAGAARAAARAAPPCAWNTSTPGAPACNGWPAEAVAQPSNLPLFSLHSSGVYLGLRGSW
jgi:hypothetical protein